MPAILTHDFFGRDAYPVVADRLGLVTLDEHDAFLLGNQGPDPLFYLVADPRVDPSNRVGDLMHHVRPARLLASLRDALTMLARSERSVGEAYAAGFLCHYLLDSSVHPLVYANQYAICDAGIDGLDRSDATEVHAEIERDLDEMVLFSKAHQTVVTYRPYREVLHASDRVLSTIDKLYFYMCLWTYSRTLELDCYTHAMKAFRQVQRLFWSPRQGKARLLGTVERSFGHRRYSLYCAMAHRDRADDRSPFANEGHLSWENPFTGEVGADSFWDIYDCAGGRVPAAVDAFFSTEFGEAAAEDLTKNLNFSGQPTDPDGQEAPLEPSRDE